MTLPWNEGKASFFEWPLKVSPHCLSYNDKSGENSEDHLNNIKEKNWNCQNKKKLITRISLSVSQELST